MPRPRYKHVEIARTRHGRTVYYYRPNRGSRVRLPDDYGSEAFEAAILQIEQTGVTKRATYRQTYTFDRNKRGNVGAAISRALRGAAHRARQRNFEFELDFEWARERVEQQEFRCAVSGVAFYCDKKLPPERNPFAPSLDRIDCSRGYTRENTRVVVFALNVMLSDWGIEVVEKVARGLWREKRTKRQNLFPHPRIQAPHPKNKRGNSR